MGADAPQETMMNQGDSIGPWWPKGTRIEAVNLTNGYPFDAKLAQQHLTLGTIYTVKDSEAWAMSSEVEVVEVPCVRFNTVHFEQSHG